MKIRIDNQISSANSSQEENHYPMIVGGQSLWKDSVAVWVGTRPTRSNLNITWNPAGWPGQGSDRALWTAGLLNPMKTLL